jgi:hypothetical protein
METILLIKFFMMIIGLVAVSYFLGYRKGREISFFDILSLIGVSVIKFVPKKKEINVFNNTYLSIGY